ncbi:helix-turn-helix domain-containing protein [Kitasatospora nipponensis]|uniref:Helix-turn-helix domain-containing protein n=1 Tax=Kitasatospora nipponensis TaxID=258049 RepID=A0ABN1WIA2_9ACTN
MATERSAGPPAGPHQDDAPCELAFDVFARTCPSRSVLKNVTHAWGSLTLAGLYDGSLRFNELRRRVDGVSEKMLSQTLHALERDGLVHREAQLTNPPRVDYRLTELGRTVAERLLALIEVVEAGLPEMLTAQDRYDAEHPVADSPQQAGVPAR